MTLESRPPRSGTVEGQKDEHHLIDAIHRVTETSDEYRRRCARRPHLESRLDLEEIASLLDFVQTR
jgi:hypothetical protein